MSLFSTTPLNVTIDSEGGTFTMNGIDMNAAAYTPLATSDVTTTTNAMAALVNVRAAITQLATDR